MSRNHMKISAGYRVFTVVNTLFMLFLSYPLSWFITASVHFVFYNIHYAKLLKRHAADESVQA